MFNSGKSHIIEYLSLAIIYAFMVTAAFAGIAWRYYPIVKNFDVVNKKCEDLSEENSKLKNSLVTVETERDNAISEKIAAELARDNAITSKETAETERDNAISEKTAAELARDNAITAKETSEKERDNAISEKSVAEQSRDNAITAKETAEKERDNAISEKTAVEQDRDNALASKRTVEKERDNALSEKNTAEKARDIAITAKQNAEAERDRYKELLEGNENTKRIAQLENENKSLSDKNSELKNDVIDKTNNIQILNNSIAYKDNQIDKLSKESEKLAKEIKDITEAKVDKQVKELINKLIDENKKSIALQNAISERKILLRQCKAAYSDFVFAMTKYNDWDVLPSDFKDHKKALKYKKERNIPDSKEIKPPYYFVESSVGIFSQDVSKSVNNTDLTSIDKIIDALKQSEERTKFLEKEKADIDKNLADCINAYKDFMNWMDYYSDNWRKDNAKGKEPFDTIIISIPEVFEDKYNELINKND